MEMLAIAAAAAYFLHSHSSSSPSSGVNPAGVRTLGGPAPAPAGQPGAPAPSPAVAANGGIATEMEWAQLIAANADKIGQAGSAAISLFDSARATGTQAADTADVGYGVPGDPSNLEQASATSTSSPSPWGSFGYTPQSIFPVGVVGRGGGVFSGSST